MGCEPPARSCCCGDGLDRWITSQGGEASWPRVSERPPSRNPFVRKTAVPLRRLGRGAFCGWWGHCVVVHLTCCCSPSCMSSCMVLVFPKSVSLQGQRSHIPPKHRIDPLGRTCSRLKTTAKILPCVPARGWRIQCPENLAGASGSKGSQLRASRCAKRESLRALAPPPPQGRRGGQGGGRGTRTAKREARITSRPRGSPWGFHHSGPRRSSKCGRGVGLSQCLACHVPARVARAWFYHRSWLLQVQQA